VNKSEFMDILENKLSHLPKEEKDNALTYYSELFDEAGEENESEIISNLKDPSSIADQIVRDYNGSKSDAFNESESASSNNGGSNTSNENQHTNHTHNVYTAPPVSERKTWVNVLLIIFFAIFGIPIAALLFSAFVTIISLVISAFAIIVSFIVSGIAALIAGIICLFISPIKGIFTIGTGLVLLSLGVLMFVPAVALIKLIPKFTNWLTSLFRRRKAV